LVALVAAARRPPLSCDERLALCKHFNWILSSLYPLHCCFRSSSSHFLSCQFTSKRSPLSSISRAFNLSRPYNVIRDSFLLLFICSSIPMPRIASRTPSLLLLCSGGVTFTLEPLHLLKSARFSLNRGLLNFYFHSLDPTPGTVSLSSSILYYVRSVRHYFMCRHFVFSVATF